jgi:hypothetical protein
LSYKTGNEGGKKVKKKFKKFLRISLTLQAKDVTISLIKEVALRYIYNAEKTKNASLSPEM